MRLEVSRFFEVNLLRAAFAKKKLPIPARVGSFLCALMEKILSLRGERDTV